MSMYLVRVELADRPGALGAVASRIGAIRGDVVGVEILDRRGGRALDEFLVDLPDDAVDLLGAEIEEVDGAVVEFVHSARSMYVVGRRDAYDGAAAFLSERTSEGALQLLARLARRELAANWSAVVDTASVGRPYDNSTRGATVLYADGPAPGGHRLLGYDHSPRDLKCHTSRLPVAEIAWAPLAAWDLTLTVGRPGRRFMQAERDRLSALARLGDARWAELSQTRSRNEHPSRVG